MPFLGVTFYPIGLSYTDTMQLAKLAENQGFDAVFGVEGGFNNDVMAMVQAMAMATERITVGSNIAKLHQRHPVVLGNVAVAIDELSRGRMILGIGASNRESVRALGLSWRDPRQALREATEWLRQIFAGETRPDIGMPFRPAQHPIPIHFAGVALETAALAGEIADGLMCYLAPKSRFQEVVSRMQRAAEQANRDRQALQVTLLIPTFVSDDLSAGREAARQFLTRYASMPLYNKMFRRSGFEGEMELATQALERGDRAGVAVAISDRLMDEVCLVGSLTRCQDLAGAPGGATGSRQRHQTLSRKLFGTQLNRWT
jgi:5,10-methylenetetrahydromethanopterin reductase